MLAAHGPNGLWRQMEGLSTGSQVSISNCNGEWLKWPGSSLVERRPWWGSGCAADEVGVAFATGSGSMGAESRDHDLGHG